MTADNPFGDPDFVRRTLTAYTQQLGALAAGAAGQRLVRAGERLASLGADIASDAFARLSSRLADEAPGGAPPITSLAALHALWVECGDAAWQAGAGREEFAEAQAEYLSALAALGATARP
jgi:hypothetical protein